MISMGYFNNESYIISCAVVDLMYLRLRNTLTLILQFDLSKQFFRNIKIWRGNTFSLW